jgi:UDP-galactopyranose mutase
MEELFREIEAADHENDMGQQKILLDPLADDETCVVPMKYDYVVVGAGLFGAVFAHEARAAGKSVLVVDKRDVIGGNIFTKRVENINVHQYGAHIFHTNDHRVWSYISQFASFNRFVHSPVAIARGELYSLPFSMYTFNKMWGVVTPREAEDVIREQIRKAGVIAPRNLEERAISLVGIDVYETLVKGYTQKQWGRPCDQLPASIIERLPVRYTFDNRYFNALYQGIPEGGYTDMVSNLLYGVDIELNVDYLEHKTLYDTMARKVVYSGAIDAYFDYCYGPLEYRSLRFENEIYDLPNFQGNAVVNYCDTEIPWTRIIEHKWFVFGKDSLGNDLPKTVITKEFSSEWTLGEEPYYPINDQKNNDRYAAYIALAEQESKTIFGGRLAEYKYYDMDAVILSALIKCDNEFSLAFLHS